MKKMKQILALLLCLTMTCSGPLNVLAEEAETAVQVCETYGQDSCICTPDEDDTEPQDVSDEEVTEIEEGCSECGSAEGHTKECSKYIPEEPKAECNCEAIDENHAETCPKYTIQKEDKATVDEKLETVAESCIECGNTEGHTEECSHYVDPNVCAECKLVEGHVETCSQYEALVEEVSEVTVPQVGDKIWIKHGSKVYKTQSGENGWSLWGNYEVEIVNIIKDDAGNTVMYEFKFTSTGWGEALLIGYKYVKVESTSKEEPNENEPVDENACNCGENASENLADHADDCPRKKYVKTLFEGKSAEEIYAQWGNYDEAIQTDLLNMLEIYDSTKYEELKYMIDGVDDSSGLDIIYVKYTGTATNGVGAKILAPEGSFPEGTTVSISDTSVTSTEVASVVADEILGIVAVDISFGGTEPTDEVMVSLDIPTDEIPEAANKVIIVHMGNNGPEVVGEKHLNTADSGETIAFKTNSFSSYAAVFVNGKYNAQKMSSVLQDNSRYQISTFNVDLFDYDPAKLNDALNEATSDGNGFHFTGYGIEGMGSNNGINNSASTHAKQGILQNNLQDGLPVINFLEGDSAGATTGKILFSDSHTVEGKTVYNDIPFEFIYDSQTGYYEYKSSANHAQLNDAKNRIELYADTLSTENNYVATLNLSTASGTSDFNAITTNTNSLKATVSDSNNNNRLDPYVLFTVDNVNASDVGQIYVKAKVPESIGSNKFQLFFITNQSTNWNEDKSFGNQTYSKEIPYTANGDWIEFVIDTSENSNWKDIITAVRVDLFDSNKDDEVDVNKSYDVEISEIRFIKKDYDAYATRGGFYPFSEIQDSYPGNNTGFNYEEWGKLLLDDELTMNRASRSIFNPAPSSESLRYEELAFGTVLEFDFYLPVDKIGLDGKDLTYYFNGDDDLWVFVDNQLVLDIGGGHGAVTGSVNFSDGTWNVENANIVTGYNAGANGNYEQKNGILSQELSSAGKHTMKIFYLERGGSVSNCFMKFNLPRTPQGSVVVSKEVAEKNNANTSELLAAEFEFQISIQNNGAGEYQENTPLDNTEYYVVGSDGTSANGETDSNGKFTLKSGQKAYFNIDENYNVTVKETQKELVDHEWTSTTVNGKNEFSLTQLTVDGEEKRFDFINTYERLYGDLKISKTGISSLDHNSKEKQSTIYVISGKSSKDESVYLEVVIVGNDQQVIKHIPIGNYTVTEKADWSWRYEPESYSHTVTVTGGETAETAFENDRTEIYWLSGDSYCENWWGGSNGTKVVKRNEKNEVLND